MWGHQLRPKQAVGAPVPSWPPAMSGTMGVLGGLRPACPGGRAAGTALRPWAQLGHLSLVRSVLGDSLRASRAQRGRVLGGGRTGPVGPRTRRRQGRGLGTGPQKEPATARRGGSRAELGDLALCRGRGQHCRAHLTGPPRTAPHSPRPSRAAPGPRASLKGLAALGAEAGPSWSWGWGPRVSAQASRGSGPPSDSHCGRGLSKPRLLPAQ